jgi:hypothetical protein
MALLVDIDLGVKAQGPQGVKGDTGERGPQGIQGVPGRGFSIAKTYDSVSAMNDDIGSLADGDFVMIASTPEDPDNATLYTKQGGTMKMISDLSGAQGIQGPQGPQGVKGDTGAQGPQGVKGDTGADGKTSYFHTAWANMKFVATEYGSFKLAESAIVRFGNGDNWVYKTFDAGDYTADNTTFGRNPCPGVPKVAEVVSDFSVDQSADRSFLGTYTDFTPADSVEPAKYAWSLIRGANGDTGAQGPQGVKGEPGKIYKPYMTEDGDLHAKLINPDGTDATE